MRARQRQAVWTVSTLLFIVLMLVLGVIIQSNYRENQARKVVTEVYNVAKSQNSNLNELAKTIVANSDQLQYLNDHPPILTADLKPVFSSADEEDSALEDSAKWCSILRDLYDQAEEVSAQNGWEVDAFKEDVLNTVLISNCLI